MLKALQLAVITAAVLFFGQNTHAQATCEAIFQQAHQDYMVQFNKDLATLKAKMEASIDNIDLQLNHRGFFAASPRLTPHLEEEMAKLGAKWWGARIYVVGSLKEAMAHSAREGDPLMQGNYLIAKSPLEGGRLRILLSKSAPEAFRELDEYSDMYFIETVFEKDERGLTVYNSDGSPKRMISQTARKISPQLVRETILPDTMTWHLEETKQGPYLYQTGWAIMRDHGIIDRNKLYDIDSNGKKELSGAYANARKLARKLVDTEGYVVRFSSLPNNPDHLARFTRSLEMVRDQLRRNVLSPEEEAAFKRLPPEEKRAAEKARWASGSRFQDKLVFDATIEAFKNNQASSVEVWGPADANGKRELAGGILVVNGAPESTFYVHEYDPRLPESLRKNAKVAVGFAEIALDALGDRMAAAGAPIMFAGMVTPFTRKMRGELVPVRKLQAILAAQKIDLSKLDLVTDWQPIAAQSAAANANDRAGVQAAIDRKAATRLAHQKAEQERAARQAARGQESKGAGRSHEEKLKAVTNSEGFVDLTKLDDETVARELIARAERSVNNPEVSLSFRNFLGTLPPPSPRLAALIAKRGIFHWGVRFIPVASVEAAKLRSLKESDHFMQANFVVVEGFDQAQLDALIAAGGPKAYREIMQKGRPIYVENTYDMDPRTGLVAMDETTKEPVRLIGQRVRDLPRDLLSRYIDPDQLEWELRLKEVGPYIVGSGYVLPLGRGVIDWNNVFNPVDAQGRRSISTTYKNALIDARKFAKQGFRFTFNTAFEKALDMESKQKHKDGSSRYARDTKRGIETYDAALVGYKAGKVFSVEVWNEKGELVGGVLATKEGGGYNIDTTFYDKAYGNMASAFPKIAGAMLLERLHAAGIPVLDMQMLSNYSKSLRGQVISTKELWDTLEKLDPNTVVDFSPWTPPATAEGFGQPR